MEEIEGKYIFGYAIIFLFVMYYVSNLNINISIVFGFCLGLLTVWILYENKKKEMTKENKIFDEKIKLLRPFPKTNNNTISNYLFSIQDFYEYNPQSYEDFVENIDNFFNRYYETKKDTSLAGVNWEIMIEQKRNIINSLQSIIYSIPSNKEYVNKLSTAVKKISLILDYYINDMKYMNDKYNYEKGINNKTKFITKSKIKPINIYTYNNEIA